MEPPERVSPTVIVTRRPRAGFEDEFAAWLVGLRLAATRFEGHVSSLVEPPDPNHPGEWTVVYRFETREALDRWLDSEERRMIVAAGAPFVDGDDRTQRLAVADERQPVTAIISVRVRATELGAYREVHDRIRAALRSFPGFVGTELFEPVPGVQDDTIVTLTFATRDQLDSWLRSERRARLVAEMDDLVESSRTINIVGSFAGWFPSMGDDDHAPRRWKQAVTVIVVLYPVSVALTALRDAALPDLPPLAGSFVSIVLGVSLLTFVLMPWVTARLHHWLSR